MTQHDFEGALDELVAEFDDSYEYFKTVLLALRIADRLQKGEVSDDMLADGYAAGDGCHYARSVFKAMSQQLFKECEDEISTD